MCRCERRVVVPPFLTSNLSFSLSFLFSFFLLLPFRTRYIIRSVSFFRLFLDDLFYPIVSHVEKPYLWYPELPCSIALSLCSVLLLEFSSQRDRGSVLYSRAELTLGIIIMRLVQEAGPSVSEPTQCARHSTLFAARFIIASNCFNWSYMRDWLFNKFLTAAIVPLVSHTYISHPRPRYLTRTFTRS